MDDVFNDPQFPAYGIDRSRGFAMQRAGATILGRNVRVFEPSTSRGRGGSRPGLAKFVFGQIPAGSQLIQHLQTVVSTDGTALLANYDDTPPDLYDPSSVGPPEAWPPGRFTRSPGLGIPEGGWAIPPNKNLPQSVVLTWANPAAISVGTPLGGSQLNAVATDRVTSAPVAGTHSYEPASGTELGLGLTQPLFDVFTPTDLTRYRRTYKTVNIDVIQDDQPDIEFVQGNEVVWDPTLTSSAGSFTSPVEEDNLLIVAVFNGYENVAGPITPSAPTITDNQLNIWTQMGPTLYLESDLGGGLFNYAVVTFFFTIASADGACNVDVGLDPSPVAFAAAILAEYTNTHPVSPFDSANGQVDATLSSTTLTTGSITVSGTSEAIIGVFNTGGESDPTPGTGFTLRVSGSALILIDKIPVSASAAAILTTSTNFFAHFSIGASIKKDD